MHDRVLRRLRALLEADSYVLTVHAVDELAEDDILAEEAVHAIMLGIITEAQTDRSTRERKYVIQGPDHTGRMLGVVVKLGISGKVVVLTAYREEVP